MKLVNSLLETSHQIISKHGNTLQALRCVIIAEKRLKVLELKKKVEHDDRMMKNREEFDRKQNEEILEHQRKHVVNRDNLYLTIAIAITVQIFVIIGLRSYFNS